MNDAPIPEDQREKAGERLLRAARQAAALIRLDDDALVGSRWNDRHGSIKIMAVVEGWIMARRPGSTPFLCHKSDWLQRFSLPFSKRAPSGEDHPNEA